MKYELRLKAYELLARLKYTTLTAGNWDDELFIGNGEQWRDVKMYENRFKN